MSDYVYKKAIRYWIKPSLLDKHEVDDVWDLFEELNKINPQTETIYPYFEVGFGDTEYYIDFVLDSTYGETSRDFGEVEKLTVEEFEQYRKMFATFLGVDLEVIESLCKITQCYYNCCEPDDLYKVYDYTPKLR